MEVNRASNTFSFEYTRKSEGYPIFWEGTVNPQVDRKFKLGLKNEPGQQSLLARYWPAVVAVGVGYRQLVEIRYRAGTFLHHLKSQKRQWAQ